MAKKEKKEIEIEEIKAPIPPVSPLFSNVTVVSPHVDMILLDFGFLAPSYRKPYELEDNHISRVCLDWDTAETFASQLKEAISEYKKMFPSKKNTKTRKGAK
jgi:hypothetical protein